jgi:serine/threonine-protein kinase
VPEPPGELAPGVPRALDEVVLKGLSKDPSERYATALEMAEALESALAPANKREIGAWVSRVAATSLAARATALEAIEKDEPVEDVPPPLPEEPSRSLPMVEAPSRRVSLSSPEASGPAVVVDAPPEGRRWGWTLATALAAAIVANLAFLGATHIGLRAGPSAGETRAAQAPAGETRAAQAPAGETRAAQAPAQAAAPAGPVPARAMIAVPTPSPVADDPVRVPPRAAHGKASASHPSTKSASCRQPFTLDHGIKVPKLECL